MEKTQFEEKMDESETKTVLTENNIKDPKQVEQYVVERLEQMNRYHKGNRRRKNRSTEQSRLI